MDHPFCEWTGVGEDGETVEPCGREASHYVIGEDGRRVYACIEHLTYAKSRAGSGALIHTVAPPEPTNFETIVD